MSIMEEFKKLDITNVAGGAASELFSHSIQEVLENVLDENRESDADRTITLTFKIKPNTERNSAAITVQAKTSLAPVTSAGGTMFFRREGAKNVGVYQHDMRQPQLPFGNVSPLTKDEVKNA